MNCQWIQQNLSAYIDNELPKDQKEMVERHLSECPQCKVEFESISYAWDTLSLWETEPPPLHLKDSIMKAVKKEKTVGLMRVLLPVAAMFIIALSILYIYKAGYYYEKQAFMKDQKEIQAPLTVESVLIDENEIIKNLQLLEEKEFLETVEVLHDIDYLPILEEQDDNRSSMGYYSA